MKKLLFILLFSTNSLNLFCTSRSELAQDHYAKGCVFLDKGNYKDALKKFNTAIDLDPNDPNFWDRRGTANFAMKNYTTAIGDYTRAINLSPKVGFYYTERALVYDAIGNRNAAMSDLVIAANYGEPAAQKIIATYMAQIDADIASSQAKAKKEMQKNLEKRFGFKPGTIPIY